MSTMPENPPATQPGEQPQADAAAVAMGLVPAQPGPAAAPPAPAEPAAAPAAPAAPAVPAAGEPWSEEFKAQYPELAAKFPTPAHMATSYSNLERVFHAFNQIGLTPEEAVQRLIAGGEGGELPIGGEGQEEAVPSEAPSDPEQFLDYMAEDPRRAIETVARDIAVNVVTAFTTAERMWNDAVTKHSDMPQYEPQMREILHAAPDLVKLPNVVERIYFMVKGGASPAAAVADARAQARAETLAQVRGSFVESGRGGASPLPAGSPKQTIVEDIFFAGQSGGAPPVLRRVGT